MAHAIRSLTEDYGLTTEAGGRAPQAVGDLVLATCWTS